MYSLLIILISCEKTDGGPSDNQNTDSTGSFNEVLFPGNGWKSIWHVHAKNTAATGIQYYTLYECGLSVDKNNMLRFIMGDTKQSQQDAFTNWYFGSVDLNSGTKSISPFTGYESWKHYYYWPGYADLLGSWTNTVQGQGIFYSVGHPSGLSYKSLPRVDENSNVLTWGTLSGNGTEDFVFLHRAGTTADSLFTDGSPSAILSGFFPALMKNGQLYAIVKLNKTVYLQRANKTNYANNQRGYLETIASISCPDFVDNLSTNFLARVSPDRRFIYYWIAENYSEPRKGWFFRFDVETGTFLKVYNNIDLTRVIFADAGSGKSSNAAIGDDGSLYITGPEDPNSSSARVNMYKIAADGTATGPILYKSTNFLQKDAAGNRYQAENLAFLNGKLYFTVRSGLLPYQNPQIDIVTEE